MKYGQLTFGQVEALVNKLGGMTGVAKILSGKQNLPINSAADVVDMNWSDQLDCNGYLYRESLAGQALFKRCCNERMTKIMRYAKNTNGKGRNLGTQGWYCYVCGRRENRGTSY